MAYEDFTTYTEVDPTGDITVNSATKVSWVDLPSRAETAYLYKDKGVDHFDGDFTHKFEMYFSRMDNQARPTYWMVSNIIGDSRAVILASGDAHYVFAFDDFESIYLQLIEGGSVSSDNWGGPGPQLDTLYFIEVVRDDDGGANNTGRVTVYIRTGSHSGALQDTLVLDCSAGQQNDFRYLYVFTTHDTSIAGDTSGYTQNMDIGAAPPPPGWTGKICGVTNPAKICGVAVADIASVMGQ